MRVNPFSGLGDSESDPRPSTGQFLDDRDEGGVVSRPVEGQGAGAGGAGHAGAQLAIVAELFHPGGQGFDVPRRDHESFDAVAHDRAGVGRDHAGQAARQRLVSHHGRSLEQRWEHEDVGRRHQGGHLGMRDPPQRLDHFEVRLERTAVGWAMVPGAGAAIPAVGSDSTLRADT